MAVAGDVTVAQDDDRNVKLHPYLVALVRWCVSCVWSTATVLLHRLVAGSMPAPAIASFTVPKATQKRAAGNDHLHPEPRVECQVLHAPADHTFDVIFVHGLYGSLGNTWRQGDWRSKYKISPNIVPLLRPTTCKCEQNEGKCKIDDYEVKINEGYEVKLNEVTYKRNGKVYTEIKILQNEDYMTENFYNNTLLDQVEIVDNFETQANFVRDLFVNENRICDEDCDSLTFECKINEVCCNLNECKCKIDRVENEVKCKINEVDCECKLNEGRGCEVGCGCVCDECYSSCWPRDWIREDYPGARVISINYTSDPYLWRPLWVKECKRLRLHERAEQMTKQLLELGVGNKPVIWVGHSKGGLFIKQIYCEAFEAYNEVTQARNLTATQVTESDTPDHLNNIKNNNCISNDIVIDDQNNAVTKDSVMENNTSNLELNDKIDNAKRKADIEEMEDMTHLGKDGSFNEEEGSSNIEEDLQLKKANLWRNSTGFMFYSVPHRGSPLADIKTPITTRSIELLEISKDNSLVLSLQERWLEATATSRPQVRSLVETCRTLMSILWLRIVSVPSADAGIGALYGVSVDHREICKPSSRTCPLYKELLALMRASLNRCQCEP